jgi:pimeloyl-ACP methyl ester carboxylesterase
MALKSVITEVNGTRIHHLEGGNGKTPLVLLHAFFSNAETFIGLIGYLGSKYKVYVPDYPGFGLSDQINKNWGLYEYNKLMSNWLRKLDIQDFVLAGLSLGGTNILHLAHDVDDLVATYILIQPYSGYKSLKLSKSLINIAWAISKTVDKVTPSQIGDKIWNSDKAISFLLNTVDPFKETQRNYKERMKILRTARFKTFVHVLGIILELKIKPGRPISQKPTVFVMSMTDNSLDYDHTFGIFSSYFPNITELPVNLVEHYPTEPLTTRYFKINYPYLLKSIIELQ